MLEDDDHNLSDLTQVLYRHVEHFVMILHVKQNDIIATESYQLLSLWNFKTEQSKFAVTSDLKTIKLM